MVPLETAGSTITGDEEANGAAGSTPSVLSRTNVTLPVTLRTGTSHDDAGIETDDEGQHDVEERVGTALQQAAESASASIGHVAGLFKRATKFDDMNSRMSKGKTVAARKNTIEDADMKKLRDQVKTMQKEGSVWDYKSLAASLVSTESHGQKLKVEVEGAIETLLKLRIHPGMKSHADRIHRELFSMYGKTLGESLSKFYSKANLTPNEFVDIMWGTKELYLTNGFADEAKTQVFNQAIRYLGGRILPAREKAGYVDDVASIDKNAFDKLTSLAMHEAPRTLKA
ncbi:unnamed protein product [Hyaloperonospora brassicae]|uniref:RxLR effector candidate protein n=1 Tax=Hyaloperonospora brassicae TaxID=162125 RepID=A0AAV0TP69_HYABA|nr:unnamed protein product [Hyaloperonospora brassicae]